ncbi:MAG: type II toxin-antitoxin system Phd/YefM family antitoxin [Chloroflexota bacterium]
MSIKYSIAEARDQFTSILRDSGSEPIEITRRGKPVAVIISIEEYNYLVANQTPRKFWERYQNWRETWSVSEWTESMDIVDEMFDNIRDHDSGRSIVEWE